MRSVLVTGALGGIGSALCTAFHDAGFRVVATDLGGPAPLHADVFIAADLNEMVHNTESFASFTHEVRKACAGEGLEILINNAAVQILGSTPAIAWEDWEKSLRVNLTAPFLMTQAFLPELEAAQGCVINIGSVHAQATKPEFVAYATTKAALHGLTRALAVDLGGRVRVVCLAPAAVATKMLLAGFECNKDGYDALIHSHPLGRIGQPLEVAAAAVLLAQHPFLFSTGSVFWLDGGVLSRLHDPV